MPADSPTLRQRSSEWLHGLPKRNGGRWGLAILAVILVAGLGLRLHDAIDPNVTAGKDSVVSYQGDDEKSYTKIIGALYRDGRYGTPDMAHPTDWSPGAPLLWAGVFYGTGGIHPTAALAFGALLGMFMVLFVYLIGRRAGGVAVGLVAAALTATYPVFIYYAGHFVTEPIGAFWLAGGVLAFLWASDDGRSLWCWLAPGALFGATALTRPEYLLPTALLALLALYRVARQREIKLGIAASVLFMVAFGLVLAPWTARNYVVLDRLVPVSTGGGKALFVATYYPGDGRQLPVKRELIRKFDGKSSVSEVTDREVGSTEMSNLLDRVAKKYPDLDRDAALGKIGKENFRKYFSEHPLGYSRMVAVKMWHVWRRSSSPTMRSQGWIDYHYALLLLGVIGLIVLAVRRRWEAMVIGALIVSITVLGGLLLGVPRRNVPLMPLVMTLVGVALVWLWMTIGGWIGDRGRRTAKPVAGERAGRPA